MLTKKITALVILSLALLSGFAIPQTSASAQRIVADVTLWDKQIGEGPSFETNGAVADLSKVRFNDRASAIQVNNGQKWRFYSEKNFKGQYIDVGPDEGVGNIGRLNNRVSSLRAIR